MCVPKPGVGNLDMLGRELDGPDALTAYLESSVSWSKRPNKKGGTSFGPLNKLMLYHKEKKPYRVDIFSTTAEGFRMGAFLQDGADHVESVFA